MRNHHSFLPVRPRRVAALLLSILLVLSLLLSAVFILVEQHHDCEGEHCKICAAVGQTVVFLKAEGDAVLKPSLAALAICASSRRVPNHPDVYTVVYSPVSLKVKLSD